MRLIQTKKMHTITRFVSRGLSASSAHRRLPQCYGRDLGFSRGSRRSRRARTARTHRHAANPADGESNDPCQDASAHEAAEPRSNRMAWSDTPNSANYATTDSRGHATRTPPAFVDRRARIFGNGHAVIPFISRLPRPRHLPYPQCPSANTSEKSRVAIRPGPDFGPHVSTCTGIRRHHLAHPCKRMWLCADLV